MLKVLVIDDEVKLLNSIKSYLDANSILTAIAANGEQGLELIEKNEYHVIISDILMPRLSGIDLLKIIRNNRNYTPVLFLSALNHTKDKIEGLEAGADDYLTKPFEFKELLLRVLSLSRRFERNKIVEDEKIEFDDLSLNYNTREAIRISTQTKISLTPKEFTLLEYFMKNPERVISRSELAEKVWNINFDTRTNIIEVYLNFLRKKIDLPNHTKLIHTVFKTGYILRHTTHADTY
ncbi:MAG: response regulator transcription factor [Saprospiraceae bacterium]|nr:response regulator transcription factor [Saprospiraceae bacterium]HMW38792.1 response regulator transcription factor [Saprospiraceae bacterium]HMX88927.1 response regulator transcription factor [Saprospiraceae bacterium]HMZ40332.1 response regulator transcription factor [Saprospiraceae bacterium]HNA65125.1 response regulator transcription factor [Saprospiraceae bacterium]